MGAVNKGNWEILPDNLTQDFLIPYALSKTAIAVSVCDAMYFAGTVAVSGAGGGDVAYPADQLATLGTEVLDQVNFAKNFVGYSQQQVLLAETNLFKRLVIRTQGVMNNLCPSQTWKHGDLVGVYSNGVTLDPQQVDKVTNPVAAIGVCVKDQAVASTRVTFRFQSRVASDILSNIGSASLFEAQAMTAANVLTDAAQTFTIATPFFSTITNTAARNITLPKESASKGLAFLVANLTASVGNTVFLGSAGGAVLCNGTIPAGKSGFAYCDGTNWYGFVSA